MKRIDKTDFDTFYHKNLDVQNRVITFMPWQGSENLTEEEPEWWVNDFTAQNLIKGLYVLESISTKPITILWLSYGGYWTSGMALYDFIRQMKSYVTMHAYGRVRSMGTIILQACDSRLLSPNCEFLIHYGTGIGGGDSEHTQDYIRAAEESKKNNATMENIYLEKIKETHPKFTRKKLQELMKYDAFLTPKKAIDLGLADGIIGEEDD